MKAFLVAEQHHPVLPFAAFAAVASLIAVLVAVEASAEAFVIVEQPAAVPRAEVVVGQLTLPASMGQALGLRLAVEVHLVVVVLPYLEEAAPAAAVLEEALAAHLEAVVLVAEAVAAVVPVELAVVAAVELSQGWEQTPTFLTIFC